MALKLSPTSAIRFKEDLFPLNTIQLVYVDEQINSFVIRFNSSAFHGSDLMTIQNCYIKSINLGAGSNYRLLIRNCIIGSLTFGDNSENFKSISIENSNIGSIEAFYGLKEFNLNGDKLKEELQLPDGIVIPAEKLKEIKVGVVRNVFEVSNYKCKMIQILNDRASFRGSGIVNGANFSLHEVTASTVEIAGVNSFTVITLNCDLIHLTTTNSGNITLDKSNIKLISVECGLDQLTTHDTAIDRINIGKGTLRTLFIYGGSLLGLSEEEDRIQIGSKLSMLNIDSYGGKQAIMKELRVNNPKIPIKINISNSEIDELDIKQVKPNNSKYEFDNVQINKLSVINSDLGDFTFTRIHFKNKNTIILQNSLITTAKFQAIQWNSNYQINENHGMYNLDMETFHWNIREAYRQLKVISIEAHNKIDANRFLQHETKYFWKQTKFKKNFQNWFVLGSNWLFSNFGESWITPLGFLLVTHLLFHTINIGYFNLEFPWNSSITWESTCNGFEAYIITLSPIHSPDINVSFIDHPVRINGVTDFFMRIFSSYFIFYFLRATRKFHFSV